MTSRWEGGPRVRREENRERARKREQQQGRHCHHASKKKCPNKCGVFIGTSRPARTGKVRESGSTLERPSCSCQGRALLLMSTVSVPCWLAPPQACATAVHCVDLTCLFVSGFSELNWSQAAPMYLGMSDMQRHTMRFQSFLYNFNIFMQRVLHTG